MPQRRVIASAVWSLLALAWLPAGTAAAAQRCMLDDGADHDRTLAALPDADTTARKRLWSVERQPALVGIKPVRVAQVRTASGEAEWVLERYPAGEPAAVQLQGVHIVNHASPADDRCPEARRASLRFERVHVPATACPGAKAAVDRLMAALQAEQQQLDARLQGEPSTGPDTLERITLDGATYVLRHHRDAYPLERHFASGAGEPADAADALIDALHSCAHDGTPEIVSRRL